MAGNEKALATVTAIIDGMGSIGAAIGPLLTGYISGGCCGTGGAGGQWDRQLEDLAAADILPR